MTRRGAMRLRRDRSGVAAIEAALVIGLVLVPLCLGVAGYGMVLIYTAQLDRALQAALFYVWGNLSGFTSAGIQTATLGSLQAAAASGFDNTAYASTSPKLTVTATTACYCVSSSAVKGASSVSCTSTCASGTMGTYVTVTASASFTLPVVAQSLTSPFAQSVTGTVRTQ